MIFDIFYSQYNPKERIGAEEAMKHIYFREFPPEVYDLPDS